MLQVPENLWDTLEKLEELKSARLVLSFHHAFQMDLKSRWEALVKSATPYENYTLFPRDNCKNLLQELFHLGSLYDSDKDYEKAYHFYLKFVTVAIEELTNNKEYLHMRVDYPMLDAKIFEVILKLELMKPNVLKRLDQGCSVSFIEKSDQLESRMRPFIFCHNLSVQPIVFQQIEIYNDLAQVFLKHRDNNLCYGLLYGHLALNNYATASHLVMITERNLLYSEYERIIPDPESGVSLPVIGCVGTSITDMIDAGIFGRIRMSELVCVICSADLDGTSKTTVFHLMNMSPSTACQKNPTQPTNNPTSCNHIQTNEGVTAVVPKSANSIPVTATTAASETPTVQIPTSTPTPNGSKATPNQS